MKKLYLITGASSGIGEALARIILQRKIGHVLGISRRQTIQDEKYQHISLDLSKSIPDNVLKNIHLLASNLKPSSITLVNNAGVVGPIGLVGSLDPLEIEHSFYVNVIAPFILTNLFQSLSLQTGVPLTVMNIGSGASNHAIEGWATYCSTKAALKMLHDVSTKEIEYLRGSTRMLYYSPSVIDTPMQQQIRNSSQEQFPLLQQFKKYKAEGILSSSLTAAEEILAQLLATDDPSAT